MTFDRLWAPWRLDYVTGNESVPESLPDVIDWLPGADRDCFLCRAAAKYDAPDDAYRKLLIADTDCDAIVILNRFPYNNGHLLVAPRRHVDELSAMTTEEHLACMRQLGQFTELYRKQLQAEGFNVGLNIGRVAGAGLPGHLHWHLVPRWHGDNNFMPVLAGTRVIPQSLDSLWELLRDALEK